MRNRPIPLIGEFYADETRPWSQQDACNYLPCVSESAGTRTEVMLKTPPGLSPLVQFPNVEAPTRGVHVAEGRCFSAVGNTLYQVFPDTSTASLGTIPGVSPVRFAHNQITGGNEVIAVNGSAGFVWNTVASTFTKITDPGYPGAIDVVFLDGYLLQIEPARRFAFHSNIADALSYNTLDRFTSEVSPDLLVGHAVNNNEYILFSESTTEFFENTGAAQQPFRSKRISFQKGCAGRYTIAQMDNTVLWLGDDGKFYQLDGYSPRRISTRPIEQAIRGLNWGQAFAIVWESEGHSVCYWTFPDGLTFGYDASQPKGLQWHRRESLGLTRWRVNSMAFWQNRWIAGDFQYGRLWELDWNYILEGEEEFVSQVTGPVMHDNQNRVQMPRLEIVMDTGQELTVSRSFGPPPVPDHHFVYFIGGITPPATSQIGYAKVNVGTGEVTVLASSFQGSFFQLHEGGIETNGVDRIFACGFVNPVALVAYEFDGTATLAARGGYVDAVGQLHGLAVNGNRLYTVRRGFTLEVLALDYNGSAFALAGSHTVSTESGAFNHGVILHGPYVLVFADNTIAPKQIKAYTVSGATFTEVGSIEVEIDEPAQPGMWSDGAYLYFDIEGTGDKVSVYTFDGATFTEVAAAADPGHLTNGVMGGNGRVLVRRLTGGAMTLDVSNFDGSTISAPVQSLPAPTYVAWAYDAESDLLYGPGGTGNSERATLYDLSQSFTPVELGSNTTPLPIPDDATPVSQTIMINGNAVSECSGIAINLDIAHPYVGDLLITITEPGGQVYTLHEADGQPGVDLVASIEARFTNLPVSVNGLWTLTITDTAASDVGTLHSWQVMRTPAVVNNRFTLHISGESPVEILEAGFIRGCDPLAVGSP